MRYSFTKILSAIALIGGLSGCIREDRSECNPGVLLKYDYSLNTEYTNLFGAEVGKVTVYVFDEKGLYYGCHSEEGSRLTNDYQMLLPLPTGRYTVVTWGGDLAPYRLGESGKEGSVFHEQLKEGVTHIDDFMLMAERANGQPLNALTDLYHGKADVTSVFQPQDTYTIPLTQDTKHIHVKVKDVTLGKPKRAVPAEPPYEIYCTGTNGRYRSDNSIGSPAAEVRYTPYDIRQEEGVMYADLNTLRPTLDRELRITVKDATGKSVFEKDLVGFMKEKAGFDSQEDFDREDEYEIVIRMEQDVAFSITINGWEAVEITPDL